MNESGVSAICIFDGQRRSKAKAEEVMFLSFVILPPLSLVWKNHVIMCLLESEKARITAPSSLERTCRDFANETITDNQISCVGRPFSR